MPMNPVLQSIQIDTAALTFLYATLLIISLNTITTLTAL